MTAFAMKDVEVLLFDVMGTVVDDQGTSRRELSSAGVADTDAVAARWTDELNAAMAEVNSGRRSWASHRQLRREALMALIDEGVMPALDAAVLDRLASVVDRYEPWPDSVAAIGALRSHVQVVALSNADISELIALSARSGLAWHAVLSGQVARRYKPDPFVYRNALGLLRVHPAHVMLVAAHAWDLRAAAEHGIRTAFVARPGATAPDPDDRFTLQSATFPNCAATSAVLCSVGRQPIASRSPAAEHPLDRRRRRNGGRSKRAATESWAPNVALATQRLHPRGVVVVADPDEPPLPFADQSFDLVTSRHPATVWWPEIARVLRPGGTYLAQHVGPESVAEVYEFFLGPQHFTQHPRHPDRERADAERAGLRVSSIRMERLRVEFYDIGAVVYFLRKVLWIVPGFTVAAYRGRLLDMHHQIENDGVFLAHSTRVLIEATRPPRPIPSNNC
jgi:2-haloalkanoic acid dehalogenase type II